MPKESGDKPRNPSQNPGMMMEQSLFFGRIENPIQLQSCLGNKENKEETSQETSPGASRNQKEPENHDGTKPVSWKNWEPHSTPELFGGENKLRGYPQQLDSSSVSFHYLNYLFTVLTAHWPLSIICTRTFYTGTFRNLTSASAPEPSIP